jgi:undecaprenyl-diphosphatase
MPSAPASTRSVRYWLLAAVLALLLAGVLAAVIFYREQDKSFGFELEWMNALVRHRDEFLTAVALVFNALGGGWIAIFVVPVGVAVLLLALRRPWAALYSVIAAAGTAGVVQLLKQLLGRARPEDILVTADYGSFPSGHSANAAALAVVLGLVFARAWVWAVGAAYTVAMMLSRTYLGAHWISDTVGGLLVGAGVAIIAWCLLVRRMDAELQRRRDLSGSATGSAAPPAR